MLILPILIILIASMITTCFWGSSYNRLMFSRSKPGSQERFERFCKKASIILTTAELMFLTLAGCFSSFDIWDILTIIALIPILIIIAKSVKLKRHLFSIELSSNKALNSIAVYLIMYYLYAFIWIKSLIYIAGGGI